MTRRGRGKRSATTFVDGTTAATSMPCNSDTRRSAVAAKEGGEQPTAENAEAILAQSHLIFRYTPRPVATRHRPVFSSSVESQGASSRKRSDRLEKMKCQGEDTRICPRRLQSRPRCELRGCPVWHRETEQRRMRLGRSGKSSGLLKFCCVSSHVKGISCWMAQHRMWSPRMACAICSQMATSLR